MVAGKKTKLRKIKEFWRGQAERFGSSPDASWGDLLMQKEIKVLAKYLNDGDRVLDVGCANGYSSIELAKKKRIKLVGIDYVPEMIKNSNLAKKKLPKELKHRLEFKVGNALKFDFPEKSFDKVIFTRCLCNLTSWDDQQKAIREAMKVLKPKGQVLISEPTSQGLRRLNKIGRKLGLKALSPPWHNFYLDEKKFLKFTKKSFRVKTDYFSSTYYLLSRIIYRWLMRDNAEKLRSNSIFNKIGVILPAFGDWGTQRLYILEKLEELQN